MNNKERDLIEKTKGIEGFLTGHEGLFLYWAVKNLARIDGVIVEIGSWKGKSTVFLGQAAKETNSQVFAVDPHEGVRSAANSNCELRIMNHGRNKKSTFGEFRENIEDVGVKDLISPIVATSEEAVKNWDKPIKFLFIDGLHDYKNCLFDFEHWGKFLADGGIVALHDSFCMWDGPEKVALEKLLKSDDFKFLGVINSITYAIRGKLTLTDSVYKAYCAALISLANRISSFKRLPWVFKLILVHRLLRFMLLNGYTARFLQFYDCHDRPRRALERH